MFRFILYLHLSKVLVKYGAWGGVVVNALRY